MSRQYEFPYDWRMRVADRIDRAVRHLGGCDRVATLLMVHPRTIERWIDCESNPGLLDIAYLAELSGFSLDWLAFGDVGAGPKVFRTRLRIKSWRRS